MVGRKVLALVILVRIQASEPFDKLMAYSHK
jgi:hypothetical protein